MQVPGRADRKTLVGKRTFEQLTSLRSRPIPRVTYRTPKPALPEHPRRVKARGWGKYRSEAGRPPKKSPRTEIRNLGRKSRGVSTPGPSMFWCPSALSTSRGDSYLYSPHASDLLETHPTLPYLTKELGTRANSPTLRQHLVTGCTPGDGR